MMRLHLCAWADQWQTVDQPNSQVSFLHCRSEEDEALHLSMSSPSTASPEAMSLEAAPSAAALLPRDPSVHGALNPAGRGASAAQPVAVEPQCLVPATEQHAAAAAQESASIMKTLSTPFMMSNPLAEDEGENEAEEEPAGVHRVSSWLLALAAAGPRGATCRQRG